MLWQQFTAVAGKMQSNCLPDGKQKAANSSSLMGAGAPGGALNRTCTGSKPCTVHVGAAKVQVATREASYPMPATCRHQTSGEFHQLSWQVAGDYLRREAGLGWLQTLLAGLCVIVRVTALLLAFQICNASQQQWGARVVCPGTCCWLLR